MCARIRGPENGASCAWRGDGESQKAKDQRYRAKEAGPGSAARGFMCSGPVCGTSSWAGSLQWSWEPVLCFPLRLDR